MGNQERRVVGEMARRIAELIDQEIDKELGPEATFEQRQDAAAALTGNALWFRTDKNLRDVLTIDEEICVEGRRYHRLKQASSATYYSPWGSHPVEEALYREAGVHNGPTIKPIELRVGIIEHMTPDMARIVGELSASDSSRGIERTLCITGLVPPSRAFVAKRTTEMGVAIADTAGALELASRKTEAMPAEVGSVSCGLDRMAVRMSEVVDPEQPIAVPRTRTEPYERTPPPMMEHHYRKAWVGTTSAYDAKGNELHTWRYAAEADADPAQLADRVAADVAWLLRAHPGVPVHCIQDAAPELRAMPEALERVLPANTNRVDLVDLEHLMEYLDDVVDTCEPKGDPRDMKGWHRHELLHHDDAIDRIWRSLLDKSKRLPGRDTPPRNAVAAALSYIRHRKDKMRYASFYAAKLPIGSGATESTCFQMQQRVKLPGQSWQPRGLRGILSIRALVLSDRWDSAWPAYAAKHRSVVSKAA